MHLFFIYISLFATFCWADNSHRPPSFQTNSGKAVFVDFQKATYDIKYDLDTKQVRVIAEIQLDLPEDGMPIFDSIANPTKLTINGNRVSQELVDTPGKETKVRVVQSQLRAGSHRLRVELPMDQEYLGIPYIRFGKGTVNNNFSMTDGEDRGYLESYLPSNLEYDQVPMTFNIQIKGKSKPHQIYSNGQVIKLNNEKFSVNFPESYTSSSPFFHIVDSNQVRELTFEYRSKSGRKIPIIAYQEKSYPNGKVVDSETSDRMLKKAMQIAIDTMEELEENFGAYPHNSFLMKVEEGDIGMEYCGATITGLKAVRHELIHSYFGRGYLPANGNAGWIDEALTTWAEDGYKSRDAFRDEDARALAAQPIYTRHHHRGGYTQGAAFIEYLHGKLSNKGGLVPFLRHLVGTKKLKTLTTEEFIKEISRFYGEDLSPEFRRVVYAQDPISQE
jgi:aminopeptidase N